MEEGGPGSRCRTPAVPLPLVTQAPRRDVLRCWRCLTLLCELSLLACAYEHGLHKLMPLKQIPLQQSLSWVQWPQPPTHAAAQVPLAQLPLQH